MEVSHRTPERCGPAWCVAVTQLGSVTGRVSTAVLLALGSIAAIDGQQTAEDDFHVYNDSPRLLLTKTRLRLLQRERERTSMRWVQFDSLVTGGAAMPEPGFAYALYYKVSTDRAA